MNPIIELRHISKTYYLGKLDVPVLHDVSLSIMPGEFVAIMGHSGSGKSTLLNILGLLDKPSGGEYLLAGKEVSRLSDDELAGLRNKFMGFVFQQFNLLPRMTARENVILPLVYADNKTNAPDELTLLERVGLKERVNHKPNELSGGQQQRVAIARALINNPMLILADEPTGNLDTKSTAEIIGILKELNNAGITIVMVTHEPDLTEAADRTITVKDGVIVSDVSSGKQRTLAAAGSDGSMAAGFLTHNLLKLQRVRDYFQQAMRSLISNKTRSFLSILGVLIGVTSLIAMMALGQGAQEEVKKNISSLGSNLLFIHPAAGHQGGVALEAGAVTQISLQDVDAIRERVPGVARVTPYASGRGQVVYNGKNWNTRIDGTSADFPVIRDARVTEGRFFTDAEATSRAKVAVIGKTVQRELFGDRDPVGEFIKIKRIDFQVIGVLPAKGSSGWRDEDDKIIIPVNTAMYRLLGKENVDTVDVQVTDYNAMDDVSDRINKLFAVMHRLPPSQSQALDIRNMADIQQTISSTTKTFSYLLGSIAFISLLVGGIGIMNIMLVSVTERTREIGLRKAIGAHNKDILFQFVIESIVICVLGGLTGIAGGTAIALALSKFAKWSISISFLSVFLAFVFSVMIGLLFGIWPARKASGLNPIEALRYE